ncbi:glycosyltransferase 87 family protein [Kocuria sp. LUK]|uniref:glycosyltransferase 87 family protein n=1 Tax=Kocuria sp. LUK TaxID=2897828 RepID=UPI001E604BBC|nr:glycosyltransferase 87 family protein [Kocuria sp. LUK]MCD1145991.1 glycosyltransferase 87 family protein [Kocuria sp. LUK]
MSVPAPSAAREVPAARPLAPALLAWVLLAGALVRTVWLALDGSIDLDVYRLGGAAVVDRHGFADELYGPGLDPAGDGGLPFTYPPFAALLFVPLAYLPEPLTELALVLASTGVAVVLSAALLRYAAARGRPLPLQELLGPATAVAAGTAVLLWSGPWMRNAGLGQINALLLALIAYDLLRTRDDSLLGRVPRGTWIGLAAGIKLTPLAFGLVFLVRGQLRPLVAMGSAFAATVLIGFLVLPRDAVVFWTQAVVSDDRVGGTGYVDNTALQGVLLHLGVPGGTEPLLRWPLVLVLVAGAALLIRVLAARGMTLSVLAVNALVMLYMSPVTWSHHHVWWPVVLTAVWVEAWPRLLRPGLGRAARGTALALAAVAVPGLYVGPIRWEAWLAPAGVPGPAIDVVAALPYLALLLLLALWAVAGLRAGSREGARG